MSARRSVSARRRPRNPIEVLCPACGAQPGKPCFRLNSPAEQAGLYHQSRAQTAEGVQK